MHLINTHITGLSKLILSGLILDFVAFNILIIWIIFVYKPCLFNGFNILWSMN